jgi:TonB family protein
MRPLLLVFGLLLLGCGHANLKIESIGQPEYPLEARTERIQGTVVVEVQIGVNGKVLWAQGSGAKPVLVQAAEQNARQWVYGPFPPKFKFPLYHERRLFT